MLEVNLMVTMTQMFNYPVFTSKLDHIAELLEATKKMIDILKSHTNITKHTVTALTVTTLVQATTM